MSGWRLSADTGGTFTDCLAEGPKGVVRRGKVLSSGCLRCSIRKIKGSTIVMTPLPSLQVGWLAGNNVRVNGQVVGLIKEALPDCLHLDRPVVNCDRGDIIEIESGLEAPVLAMRMLVPELADSGQPLDFRLGTTKGTNALLEHKGAPVAMFLTKGFEDLLVIRDQKRPDLFAREIRRDAPLYKNVFGISGRIDAGGQETQPLDEDQLAECGRQAIKQGCAVAAVCFLNSWASSRHEKRAVGILQSVGFSVISASSQIRPLIKYLDRADTTLVNATLSPVMDAYLDQVQSGIHGNPLWIMTSAGGLVSRERFHAVDSLVSGPAGGLLGAVEAGRRAGMNKIIGLDMGGTSTDVSRWKDRLELRQQLQVGNAKILTPAMPIETVAAGGGSVCGYREGRLFVGPESAGANPGPASYGAGGPLCLTDVHLLLGRIDPEGFSIPIRLQDARNRLDEVMKQSGESDWRALAEGFLTIATERMTHAIRQVTLRDGEDPSGYGLVAFGGAGGLHACRVASQLGIKRIVFPSDAGILSAKGIHYAPRESVREVQYFSRDIEDSGKLEEVFGELAELAREDLSADGVDPSRIGEPLCSVYVRMAGQESGMPVEWGHGKSLLNGFKEKFVATFGYFPGSPTLEIVKLRVHLREEAEAVALESFNDDPVPGPHVIRDPFGTFFVEKGWAAIRGSSGGIEVVRSGNVGTDSGNILGKVQKTLVMNRLEGLVEEMGDQLQRTALSTNIRERLDFSCALLDSSGHLLVNAPHIPVHLGAMGLCVRECAKRLPIGPDDVIMTNHPRYGGSHLPDVTLIRGLFDKSGQLAGYLANRAHHAEWGGKTPGSMPADAASLAEEGVVFEPRHIIRNGTDCFQEIELALTTAPFPTRTVHENRIDLEAQLASLQRGVHLFNGLMDEYGSKTVRNYFHDFYQEAADSLSMVLNSHRIPGGHAQENLDDGHAIKVTVSGSNGGLIVDFTGTSPVHERNLNATPAIVQSAVLYVLRLLVDKPMPLNEGLLENVQIRLPDCFLNPRFSDDPYLCPAVVGGNVETSQRVVDALIRAFGLMAAGQGTMNNFLFGNERFGYYETIGGGSGAGKFFNGASGVHVHMTNTAITDPEILEQRFPVKCREFSLRKNSGGAGSQVGGDGLVREVEFLEPVTVSLLTQNRGKGARGASGGLDGKPGCQWLLRRDRTLEPLKGIAQVELQAGEAIRIETPGGGGWGKPVEGDSGSG